MLVLLALLAGGLYWGATTGIEAVRDRFSDPEDYAGPGSGSVRQGTLMSPPSDPFLNP